MGFPFQPGIMRLWCLQSQQTQRLLRAGAASIQRTPYISPCSIGHQATRQFRSGPPHVLIYSHLHSHPQMRGHAEQCVEIMLPSCLWFSLHHAWLICPHRLRHALMFSEAHVLVLQV